MNFLYKNDLKRYGGARGPKRIHWLLRKSQCCNNKIMSRLYGFLLRKTEAKRGIEISRKVTIGKGLYLGHPYGITVNDDTIIGENCNLHKGCTIGRENRGKRKGVPEIGNCVWVGINATVVGKIKIGNDVLIAPNSFVNVDVPDHSIVFGNPCVIKHSDNATEGYINNRV